MSWKTLAASANAAQLRAFGSAFSYANRGATEAVDFNGVRNVRLPDAASTSTKESIWSRTTELDPLPIIGASIWLCGIEYVMYDVRPDQDPDSDGVTLYLDRKGLA